MAKPLEVLLLVSLPGAGKAEVRHYLAGLGPEQGREFALGPFVVLDDYPYVHLMRRISQESQKQGLPGVFFDANELPMKEPLDWGMLVELLNEDFADLVRRQRPNPSSAAEWLFARFDAARTRVGAAPAFGGLAPEARRRLVAALEKEAAAFLKDRNANVPASLDGRTVLVVFARGGKDGATQPLAPPYGYQYSLGRLSDELLAKASLLHVAVTPEEARRRNRVRADPNNPVSAVIHVVPLPVMMVDYGCDDLGLLAARSDRPDTLKIATRGRTFYVPTARFDNRVDKTSFVRGPRESWPPASVEALHAALAEAFARLQKAQAQR